MSDPLNGYADSLLHSGYRQRSKKSTPSVRDKMQPSLLDRLTDDAPQQSTETVNHTLISHSALRRNVLRDLQWLFNCTAAELDVEWADYPHVRRSVANFGVLPLSGKRMSDIEWGDIQRKLTEAIVNFEPRILPQGLQVRCVSELTSLNLHNVLSIEIKGRLWCVPYPLEFLFRTDVDLENGHFELQDIS